MLPLPILSLTARRPPPENSEALAETRLTVRAAAVENGSTLAPWLQGARLVGKALRERGLKVFKYDWYLSPGDHWPSALERRLAHCKAVAVLIGPNGMGPWQQREVYTAIDREVREQASGHFGFRVIPVLLDQGGRTHAGLGFLSQNVWVEAWDPRAVDLIAGALEGKAPAELYDEAHPDPRTLICPSTGPSAFSAKRITRSTLAVRRTCRSWSPPSSSIRWFHRRRLGQW